MVRSVLEGATRKILVSQIKMWRGELSVGRGDEG